MAAKRKDKKRSPSKTAKPTAAVKPPAEAPPPADSEHAKSESEFVGVPIVGIGASAGGLDAFKKLFLAMPAETGIAFVLIPHLDPKHESLMVELLSRHTRMPVVEAKEGMTVEANRVYILPPNKYMTIAAGVLRLTGPVERGGLQTSIDLFLRSLAEDQQERAICIILSGTGSHGTLGLKAVKAVGGMAMVQEPETAEYARMPQSAIATGLADYVLPVEKMPEALVKYVQHFYVNGGSRSTPDVERPDLLHQVLALLRVRTKFDFRCYRKKMLMRRVERRMGLNHFENLAEYLAHLRDHPDEVRQLARDLMISVTSFFRDAESLQALEKEAIVALVSSKSPDAPLRVWVPACATGEEAYSIAILLLEELARAQKNCRLQIFATDVDEDALTIARQGIYPESISADVSPERLARFFTKADESAYQISKQVRESIVFAPQNLIADAPFSKVDLVSCRNVLIYLEPEVQAKVLTLLHFALNEGGYLLVGPSETIGRQTDLFEPVSKKWRIFRRIGPTRPERVEFPISAGAEPAAGARRPMPSGQMRPVSFAELTQRFVLEEVAPAAVLINRKYEVLYFLGPTTRYLDVPTGEPTQDLIMMAREGLRTKLRSAIHQAIKDGQPVHLTDSQVRRNGGYVPISVTIKPVMREARDEGQAASGAGLLLVLFQDIAPAGKIPTAPLSSPLAPDPSPLVQQLEYELRATKEDLQSSIEEMESSNEELKASNEEVMSMNEELQSANEELETSKEELQSLNEELTTVNNQLHEKIQELESANNDMANLLNCTDIATVFLDTKFRIRRFTEPATQVLNVIATDVGRPISDITFKFTDPDLLGDATAVLHQLTPREKDVRTADAHWYLRRIVPYRTVDNRIEGVVLTLTDISQIKQAAEQSRYLATVLVNSSDAVMVHDLDGRISAWNRGAERLYGYSEIEARQLDIMHLVPEDVKPSYRAILDRLRRGEEIESFETRRIAKNGRVLDVWVTSTALTDDAGRPVAVAKTDRDITERKKAQANLQKEVEHRTAALQESESRLRAILNSPDDAIITFDHDGMIDSVNPAAERMFGYSAAQMIGRNVLMLMPSFRDKFESHPSTGDTNISGVAREILARRKDGTIFHVDLAVSEVEQRQLFTGIVRDITRRKELEREVVEIAALEQQRIGQDLHDQCGQELTALGLFADTLASSLQERSPADVELVHKIGQRAKGVLRQVRSIAQGLALAEVEANGLPDALAELASRLGETSGIRCVFHGEHGIHPENGIQATHLYHIAQEACTNALKHASAKNIEIRLNSNDNALILTVGDDGLGMPMAVKSGLGVRIMRNRANVIGAKLSIEPTKPHGTTVTCALTHERHHGRKQH